MTATPSIERQPNSPVFRHAVRWSITLAVLGLVAWFTGDTLRDAWTQLSAENLHVDWAWVALAALFYIAGLSPMALYWQRALASLGQHPPAMNIVRAYYLGHLGKYVPGKALVAVLRTGALVAAGCDMRRTVVSVFLETLTFMATGGAVAALLLAFSGHGTPTHALLAAGLAIVAGLPVTPPIAKRLAGWGLAKGREGNTVAECDELSGIGWSLTAWGVCCASVAWTLIGLSLWAALRAVGVDTVSPIGQLALWVEAVALPVVAGFLSLIPGGLLVRDGLQVELLTSAVSPSIALVAVALWRVTSVASEVAICVILEASRLYRASVPPRDDTL